MIKVIHVVSDANIGGAGRWVLNFLKEVDKERFAVQVAIPQGSLLKSEIEKLKGQTVEIPGMADRSFDTRAIGHLYRFFRKEKPDIVHTHASLSARIAARMAGIKPIVYTKHCIDRDIQKGMKAKLISMANVFLSDKIIAVAEAARENLIASGIPEGIIEVLHNGVEKLETTPQEEQNQLRAQWGIGEHETVFGIVARLEEVKGHCYFIEAAQKVVNVCKDVKFLVVGTGSLEQVLKEKVKTLGLEPHMIFTGHINEIGPVMNIIDVNIISSLSEALCLSIIEAMSIGKPCIATRTGGNPELVQDGDSGILVPVGDGQALADAMIRLAQDRELRKSMGQRGKELMGKHFTAHAMAKKLEEIYIQLVRGGY